MAKRAAPTRRPASQPTTIDGIIALSPAPVRARMERIRRIVHAEAPDAEETISYRMPAFRQHGILLFFAAFQSHIGIYPPVKGDAKLVADLAPFAGPKGNLKFPHDSPLPVGLIRRIVRLRVRQDRDRAASRKRT